MSNLYDLGVQLILYLQGLGGWLLAPMETLSSLGSEQFFLLVMPFLYWCLEPALGARIGLVLLLSNGFNSILKLAFQTPRPFWYTREVAAHAYESTFGIPSGHAQNAAAIWGVLAAVLKRAWFWGFLIALVFLIGLSRVYLAVHFPQDVIVGWLIGIMVVWAYTRLEMPVKNWLVRQNPAVQISIAFFTSLVLLGVFGSIRIMMADYQLPVEWVENAQAAFPDEPPINPLSPDGILTAAGAFFGFSAGLIWLNRRGGFDVRGSWWQRGLRFLIGLAGLLLLWAGLGAVFPEGQAILAYVLRYLRYALVGAWVSGFAPIVFIWFGLAKRIELLRT